MKSLLRIGLMAAILVGGMAVAGWAIDLGAQIAKKIRYPDYDANGQLNFEVLGDEAQVMPDGVIHVVNLKLILYEEGRVMMEVTAPECLLDRARRTASSTSTVCVARSEMILTGRGYEFTWENNLGRLKIQHDTKVVLRGVVKK